MAWYDDIANTTKGNVQGLVDALRNPQEILKQGALYKNKDALAALLRGETAPIMAKLNEKSTANPMEAVNVASSMMPMMGGIISKDIAKNINIPITLPKTPEFHAAVEGTTGANVTPEGLSMSLQRFQKPEQELEQSVRTGVFYLPEGAAQAKYYKGSNSYGGKQAISGETLYKNPLFVKGATGGKAPEEAYKQLVGKDKFNEMQSDLQSVIHANIYKPRTTAEEAYMFLEKHAPEIADDAWHIVQNSKEGNQLRYALQEAVAANEARNAGHDVILGHSKGKNGPYISEAFDLRESHYPSPSGEFYMHPQFEDLVK